MDAKRMTFAATLAVFGLAFAATGWGAGASKPTFTLTSGQGEGTGEHLSRSVPGSGPALVRLYRVERETELTDAKVAHSDSAAFLFALSVDGDSVQLHHQGNVTKYTIVGKRTVYQPSDEAGEMQLSAPALVAVRFDQGRIELLTVTPKQLTVLRSLEAIEGYVLTTARFIGEQRLPAGSSTAAVLPAQDPDSP
ncbi:MAG TPA: hypothetical protein VGD78_18030 [Chthoniobacterales bacterium]